jgi:hypothetical protein
MATPTNSANSSEKEHVKLSQFWSSIRKGLIVLERKDRNILPRSKKFKFAADLDRAEV